MPQKVADGEETVVAVPVIAPPVQVQPALVVVDVEVGHIAVIEVLPDRAVTCALHVQLHHPLNTRWVVSRSGHAARLMQHTKSLCVKTNPVLWQRP